MLINYKNICIPVLLLLISAAASGQIYRWVDENGRVHYSDEPPDQIAVENIEDKLTEPNEAESASLVNNKSVYQRGTNITNFVAVTSYQAPLSFELFSVTGDMSPSLRLLDIGKSGDSLWFSSDIGLVRFVLDSQNWYLIDRNDGLPGQMAYDLYADQDRLLIRVMNKRGGSYLTQVGYFWFNTINSHISPAPMSIMDYRAGGRYTAENSDLIHDPPADVLHHQDKVWLTSYGKHVESNKFENGGVAVLNPLTKRGVQYTVKQGLSDPYCYELTTTEDQRVWVTHWEEDRGISYIKPGDSNWQVAKISKNGVELGGPRIAFYKNYVIVGQQRALVLYDPASEYAISVDKFQGLPGHIVSDIFVDDNYIYVTAYSIRNPGYEPSGMIRIATAEIDSAFQSLVAQDAKDENNTALP